MTNITGVSPTRLIAAWGDSETIGYHASDFVKGEAIMFGLVENSNADPLLEIVTSPEVSFFDVAAVSLISYTFRKVWVVLYGT